MKIVTNLYIYPIKSLGGMAVDVAKVTSRGLEHDRRWMLVDEHHSFLSQRSFPRMAQLRTAIHGDLLEVHDMLEPGESLRLPLALQAGETIKVDIWDDVCDAISADAATNAWFSERLGQAAKLVYMPDASIRPVDPGYAVANDITSFSDGYPVLIIGQASLDLLNSKLDTPVPMERFRPNIVFSGGEPHEEDGMRQFSINGVGFLGVKPCARCVMTTIDQDSAIAGKEPLRTLSTYRNVDQKIMFGQNLLVREAGVIKVGAQVLEF